MAKQRLLDIVEKFARIRLLVIGDLMLDCFIWGDVQRISPEAPVPVLRVTSESFRLGGAANVMHNVRSLGGQVEACGIIGTDSAGKKVLKELRKAGVMTAGVIAAPRYQTVQKTRVIASPRHQQIVRLDRENDGTIPEGTLNQARAFLTEAAARCDAIVVSDYGKGVVHRELLDGLADLTRRKGMVCVIDPKKENYARYRHPSLVTPNKDEAGEASGIPISDERSLCAAGSKLLRMWRARAVMITRGSEGISLFRAGNPVRHFPTAPRDIFDVTGAGDTVVAVCALALACGASYEETAMMANLAAGLVGDEVGTVAVPRQRLIGLLEEKQL
ncbi:MAG TPA: PfkB family carbohydrate kinase [Candidatus Binatia bacterium]|nr:PfkB family carbohydrate kinase [Candidatus Binatia bacterium]